MKILCETSLIRRNSPNIKGKFLKSTLAIGKKEQKSNLCLILITSSNKSGTKYDLTNNIAGIFRKFVDEGKCTISFKLPENDLQIKANAIQLKAFLNVMKEELCPNSKKDPADNKMLRAFASTNKMITDEVKKLVITKRSDFPTKGFPRTLQVLQIQGVGCLQMPIGILNLTNLTSLDLSNNQMTKIHKSLGNLRLKQLILTDNKLGESSASDWQWMNGKNLQASLQLLNISKNKLKGIPSIISYFENLVTLNLSSNEIMSLPFAIQHLKELRNLNLKENKMALLPCTFTKLRLNEVDLSENNFGKDCCNNNCTHERCSVPPLEVRVERKQPTLFELSARVVLNKNIPYKHKNIPQIIKEIIHFSPTCCHCSNFCFDRRIHIHISKIRINSKAITTDHNLKDFYTFGPICSPRCVLAGRTQLN